MHTLAAIQLSIPLWFDWGPPPGRTPPDHRPFQSHFGSIGAPHQALGGAAPGRLSIPLWFDWGQVVPLPVRHLEDAFQSHFGSIGARRPMLLVLAPGCFQSHFGSIGARPALVAGEC